jgi:hypothetical protein
VPAQGFSQQQAGVAYGLALARFLDGECYRLARRRLAPGLV